MSGMEDLDDEYVVDEHFGNVRVELDRDAGRLEVRADALPEVTVERLAGAAVKRYVPIGTRDARALVLRVDGVEQELRPGPGRISRGSYRVRVRVDGADLLFTPCGPTGSRLCRGRSFRPDFSNQLGVYERYRGGRILVEWGKDVTIRGVTVEAPRPEPVEAAVGYALAGAFGAGARFFFSVLLDGLEQGPSPI